MHFFTCSLWFRRVHSFLIVVLHLMILPLIGLAQVALPDLEVTSVVLDPTTVNVGDSFSVRFTVRNIGEADAGPFENQIGLGKSQSRSYAIVEIPEGLKAGAELVTEPVALQVPSDFTMGTHSVLVSINLPISIQESGSRSNNSMSAPLEVISSRTVDLVMEKIETAVTSAPAGGDFSVTVFTSGTSNFDFHEYTYSSFRLSTDAVWSSSDLYVGTTSSTSVASESQSTILRLPLDTVPGDYYLIGCIDPENYAVESDEANNCKSIPFIAISSENIPDLSIIQFTLQERAPYPGDFLMASIKINNDTTVAVESFQVSGYIQSSEDVFHFSTNEISGIPGNTTLTTEPLSFQIPYTAKPGGYLIYFCVDPNNEIVEMHEFNNCLYRYYFTVDGRRDLEAASLSVSPSIALPGQIISMPYVVKNNGYTLKTSPLNVLYLSADPIVTQEDPIILTWREGWILPKPGEATTVTTAMPNVPAGTYTLELCTDYLNEIEETDENNNCTSSILVVSIPEIAPAKVEADGVFSDVMEAAPGDTVNLFFSLRNTGGRKSQFVRVYVSIAYDLTVSAKILIPTIISDGIPAGETRFFGPIPVIIPSSMKHGRALFLVEVVEGNNDPSASRCHLHIGLSAPPRDLNFGGASNPASYNFTIPANVPFDKAVSVYNDSETGLESSVRTTIRWSVNPSPTPGDSRELASFDTKPISSLNNDLRSILVKLPDDAPAVSYLTTCIDATGRIEETDEENNCRTEGVTIAANSTSLFDLRFSNLSLDPGIVPAGGSTYASLTVVNDGHMPTDPNLVLFLDLLWATEPHGSIYNLKYIEPTATIPVGILAAGESRDYKIHMPVPKFALSGRHYVVACAELHSKGISAYYNGQDINTSNDCASTPIQVLSTKSNDVMAADLVLSTDRGSPGDTVVLAYTAANKGNAVTPKFANAIRWSRDLKLSGDDHFLRVFIWGGLNSYDSVRVGPIKFRIPLDAKAGTYYVAACTDSEYHWLPSLPETDEDNNCSFTPFTVIGPVPSPTPSMEVVAVRSDLARASGGDAVQVSWDVKNGGGVPTGPIHFEIRLDYLESRDSIALGESEAPGIQAGLSGTFGPFFFHIPITARPGFSYLTVTATLSNGNSSQVTTPFLIGEAPAFDLLPYLYLPAEIEQGSPLPIIVSVANTLKTLVQTGTRTVIYWSPDPNFESYNYNLADLMMGFLDPNGKSLEATLNLPEDAPLGSNYITACVDPNDIISETDETNNCHTATVTVLPAAGSRIFRAANLSLNQAISIPPGPITASFTVESNNSGQELTAYFLLSTDPVLDELDLTIKEVPMGNLWTPGTQNQDVIGLPEGLVSGIYHIGVCLRESASALKPGWRRDCPAIPIEIQSDRTNELQLKEIGISSRKGAPGSTIWLSFEVVNNGNLASPAFSNSIRWSTCEDVSDKSPELRRLEVGGLNASENLTVGPVAVSVPENVKQGSYYIAVCADVHPDSPSQVQELNKDDNCVSVPFTVIGGSH